MSPRTVAVAGIAADADTMTETEVYFDTPGWHALIDWLAFHGIDAMNIPGGTRVSRDECGRCIRYVGVLLDEKGRRRNEGEPHFGWVTAPMVEQGEAPPLPYPDVIARQMRPVRGHPHPPPPLPNPVVPSP